MTEHTTETVQHEGAEGQVVRYLPDQSRHDPRWCREGMAISDHMGRFVDTYWVTGSDAHILNAAELATIEHLFWLDDYRELDTRSGRFKPREWETYAEADRQRITSQHGLRVRYFVRNGASPDLLTQVQNASDALDSADADLRSAQRRRDLAEERLRELQALLDLSTPPGGTN